MIIIVNQILSILTLLSHIFIVVAVIFLLFSKGETKSLLKGFLSRKVISLAFIVSLVAMLGSLFYSEIAHYTPCDLCWYQRIFMYPQVFILALAWWKNDEGAIKYNFLLSIIGGLISIYHNYLSYGGITTSACANLSSAGISCLRRYVLELGYITLPLMSLSAFLLLILIYSAHLYSGRKK